MMGDESLALGVDRLKFDELKTDRMMKEGAVLDELREKLSFRENGPADEDETKEGKQEASTVTPLLETVDESQPTKSPIKIVDEVVSPRPVVRPTSPSSSVARSELSVAATSDPPLVRDREDSDEPIAPTTPRSTASGRVTPTKRAEHAIAAKIAAVASGNKKEQPAASSQVKNLASTFTTDIAAQQEKQRKLDQLRGGSFKSSQSKKWTPQGSTSMKLPRVDPEAPKKSQDESEQSVSGVSAMKRNWELGKASSFVNRSSTAKQEEEEKPKGGFGDLMKRFKVIEGSEKSQVQKTQETRQGITSKAAMFETGTKKPGKGALKPKAGGASDEAKSNSIRGRAAMFEKK